MSARRLILLNRYMKSALRVTLRTDKRKWVIPPTGSIRIYDINDQTARFFLTDLGITCITEENDLFIFSRNLCLTGERLICLMDSVFKYGSLNNGHSKRRGMLKIIDIFIIVNCIIILLSCSQKAWKLSYCCNLCPGEKFLRQLSESLLC